MGAMGCVCSLGASGVEAIATKPIYWLSACFGIPRRHRHFVSGGFVVAMQSCGGNRVQSCERRGTGARWVSDVYVNLPHVFRAYGAGTLLHTVQLACALLLLRRVRGAGAAVWRAGAQCQSWPDQPNVVRVTVCRQGSTIDVVLSRLQDAIQASPELY